MHLHTEHLWEGSPARPDEVARVALTLDEQDLLIEVSAPFHGDPAPPGPPGPLWRLWEHEVVELFVLGPDGRSYTEVELGPHGHHLLLRLEGVRQIVQERLPMDYRAKIAGTRWTGLARVPAAALPPQPWHGNLTAVHGVTERRYLTWRPMPGPAPDFHRLHAWAPLHPA